MNPIGDQSRPAQILAVHSNNLLDADSFLNLLGLIRQVIDAGKFCESEYGIIIKSKAVWTALKNASDFYKSKGI